MKYCHTTAATLERIVEQSFSDVKLQYFTTTLPFQLHLYANFHQTHTCSRKELTIFYFSSFYFILFALSTQPLLAICSQTTICTLGVRIFPETFTPIDPNCARDIIYLIFGCPTGWADWNNIWCRRADLVHIGRAPVGHCSVARQTKVNMLICYAKIS